MRQSACQARIWQLEIAPKMHRRPATCRGRTITRRAHPTSCTTLHPCALCANASKSCPIPRTRSRNARGQGSLEKVGTVRKCHLPRGAAHCRLFGSGRAHGGNVVRDERWEDERWKFDGQWSRVLSQRKIMVIPNGVDTEFYAPRERARNEPILVFTGKRDFRSNVDAMLVARGSKCSRRRRWDKPSSLQRAASRGLLTSASLTI